MGSNSACNICGYFIVGVRLANKWVVDDVPNVLKSYKTIICDEKVLEKLKNVSRSKLSKCECPINRPI